MSQLAWAHETLIWASKGKRHTFNYDLINGPNPTTQLSSVWRIPAVSTSLRSTRATLRGGLLHEILGVHSDE